MAEIPADPKQVLDMALQNEVQGHKILSDARDICQDKLAKATFDFLAKEELKHIEIIKRFAQTGVASAPLASDTLSRADAAREIKGIFAQFGWQYEQVASEFNARAEAYRTAMEMERHGHHFYHQAAENAQDPEVKKFFDFLAAEEVRHFEILQDSLDFLEQPDAMLALEERWMQS